MQKLYQDFNSGYGSGNLGPMLCSHLTQGGPYSFTPTIIVTYWATEHMYAFITLQYTYFCVCVTCAIGPTVNLLHN
jgi:hypothetical protein